jgi:hypothetical protein
VLSEQQNIIKETFQLVSKRDGKKTLRKFHSHESQKLIDFLLDNVCNFLECGSLNNNEYKLIYRHYATLYFVFCVDCSESELGKVLLSYIRGVPKINRFQTLGVKTMICCLKSLPSKFQPLIRNLNARIWTGNLGHYNPQP